MPMLQAFMIRQDLDPHQRTGNPTPKLQQDENDSIRLLFPNAPTNLSFSR